MNFVVNDWSMRLVNASFQGGLALGIALLIVSYVPKLPAQAKVWVMRIALLKMLLAALAPMYIVLAPFPRAKPGHYFLSAFYPAFELLLPIAAGLWALAVAVGLWRLFQNRRQLSAIVNDSDLVDDIRVRTVYRKLCQQYGIANPPGLRSHLALPSPVLVKHGAISIVLPASLLGDATTERLEVAIAHELAHYRHRDLRWSGLVATIDLLFFFHPLVGAALKKLRLAEEYAADEAAMRITQTGPSTYSKTLLSFVATSLGMPALYAMADSAKELDKRIKQVYANNKPRSRYQTMLACLAMGVGILALLPWTIAMPRSEPTGTSSVGVSVSSPSRIAAGG